MTCRNVHDAREATSDATVGRASEPTRVRPSYVDPAEAAIDLEVTRAPRESHVALSGGAPRGAGNGALRDGFEQDDDLPTCLGRRVSFVAPAELEGDESPSMRARRAYDRPAPVAVVAPDSVTAFRAAPSSERKQGNDRDREVSEEVTVFHVRASHVAAIECAPSAQRSAAIEEDEGLAEGDLVDEDPSEDDHATCTSSEVEEVDESVAPNATYCPGPGEVYSDMGTLMIAPPTARPIRAPMPSWSPPSWAPPPSSRPPMTWVHGPASSVDRAWVGSDTTRRGHATRTHDARTGTSAPLPASFTATAATALFALVLVVVAAVVHSRQPAPMTSTATATGTIAGAMAPGADAPGAGPTVIATATAFVPPVVVAPMAATATPEVAPAAPPSAAVVPSTAPVPKITTGTQSKPASSTAMTARPSTSSVPATRPAPPAKREKTQSGQSVEEILNALGEEQMRR